MPFTFSAGSFSFLKSSTTSQSNIKQNNNVDNVNNNNNNNIINDNLDMGKNISAYHPSLNNFVIPLDRRVRSLDNSETSTKSNRRSSNASNSSSSKNTNNRKAWYKSIFVRIHQTFSRSNDGDTDKDDSKSNITNDYDDNTVENNSNNEVVTGSESDDDPIIMKPKNIEAGTEANSFICHGNTHDFYVVTKNGSMSDGSMLNGSLSNGSLSNGPLKSQSSPNFIPPSVFEECAKTPRHFAKEPEVLGKVGRFTIVREREDFDTTYFDQCHCQQKPCRFSTNGCSGTHPVLPPGKESDRPSRHLSQVSTCSNKNDSWSSSKSRRSFYSNNTPSSNSSRSSLQQQKYYGVCPTPIMVSKPITPNFSSSNSSFPTHCRVILPQSSSSPNLVHLNQRSKFDGVQNKNTLKNMNCYPNSNIIVGGNSVSMKSTEEEKRRLSMPPTTTPPTPPQPLNLNSSSTPTTPTTLQKFHYHHPNEPHTTINSHSGRKFEVEWNTTAKSSSSSSTSSSSSSDTAYSPPSTISSAFSMASSPDKKSTINNTLSRRCSTLSSKCGRKFEVTILSSSSSPGNNCILNTSPHSTIGSVNSIIVDATNTDTHQNN
ncbi:hypothetical protein GLOIN_2v1654631 [Rhizophagus clarus]|uniref:Uncharacterized protein n=1 Tax=Rhizophagus clarus TaxID=94130 RepID=A0A8H3QGY5_9GLOM|nr:hypothetical protein GLOIN_2v1654631 [Rhizophagus clarus]